MTKYKSVFVSDVHLGIRGITTVYLYSFLSKSKYDNLFLVGDIIDGWAIKHKHHWNKVNTSLINLFITKFFQGVKIVYLYGNHDEFLKEHKMKIAYDNNYFEITDRYVYESFDKKYLIVHGDIYDSIVEHAKWLGILGGHAYNTIFNISTFINSFFKEEYWSLSKWIKTKVKSAVTFVSKFEECVAMDAKKNKANGVVCGHIHSPNITKIDDIEYMNCGDSVESHTCLVEHLDGRFEIINLKQLYKKST